MSEQRDSNLDMFNESFYRADPADYLRSRLQLWAIATTKPNDVAALASGIHVSGVQLPVLDVDAHHDIDAFRTIDALNMRHHAAETVLRLFVAHAKRPRAPGLDLAERTNFAKFKQLVRDEILDTPPTAELVADVFLGSSPPDADHNPEDWNVAVANTILFLQEMAKVFLTDAAIYNAIKHGLGAAAGSARLRIEHLELGRGESVVIPTRKRADNHDAWAVTTLWVSIDQAIRLVAVGIEMIESIWNIGRARCLPPGPTETETIKVFFPNNLRPADIETSDQSQVRSMSWDLVRVDRTHPTPHGE